MEHPPFLRSAKTARCSKLCGPNDTTRIPGVDIACSHGGAWRHRSSRLRPSRHLAIIERLIERLDGARHGPTVASRIKCATVSLMVNSYNKF